MIREIETYDELKNISVVVMELERLGVPVVICHYRYTVFSSGKDIQLIVQPFEAVGEPVVDDIESKMVERFSSDCLFEDQPGMACLKRYLVVVLLKNIQLQGFVIK